MYYKNPFRMLRKIKRRVKMFVTLGVLAFAITACGSYVAENASADEPVTENYEGAVVYADQNELQTVTVDRVIDGDTVDVKTEDGEPVRVRMIGVNTPESVSSDESKNCEEGDIASEFTKSQLTEGQTIYLEYDEDLNDQYGRTLAYIWLTNDCDRNNFNDFCQYNYGAILLQNTYCEAVYYAPNGMYREWYESLDQHNM